MREIAEILDGHLLAPEDTQRVLARPDPDLRELGDEPLVARLRVYLSRSKLLGMVNISGEGSSSYFARSGLRILREVVKTEGDLFSPRLHDLKSLRL